MPRVENALHPSAIGESLLLNPRFKVNFQCAVVLLRDRKWLLNQTYHVQSGGFFGVCFVSIICGLMIWYICLLCDLTVFVCAGYHLCVWLRRPN